MKINMGKKERFTKKNNDVEKAVKVVKAVKA